VDEATEARLYRLLRERLPDTTLFSIGHRTTLHSFHARRLVVQLAGNAPGTVVELPADLGPHDDLMRDEDATKPW